MIANITTHPSALVIVPGSKTPEDICQRLRRTMGPKMLQTFRQFIVDWPGIEATVGRLAEYVSDGLALRGTGAKAKPILEGILAQGLAAYEEALEMGHYDRLRFMAFVEACLEATAISLKGLEIRAGTSERWTADTGAPLLWWLEEAQQAGEISLTLAAGCTEESVRRAVEGFLLCEPDRQVLKEARREWAKQEK